MGGVLTDGDRAQLCVAGGAVGSGAGDDVVEDACREDEAKPVNAFDCAVVTEGRRVPSSESSAPRSSVEEDCGGAPAMLEGVLEGVAGGDASVENGAVVDGVDGRGPVNVYITCI